MAQSEEEAQFARASHLYLAGRYEESLELLSELDERFPNTLNILKAKARTLAKLGRNSEAIALCDRLLNEFGYEKALNMRERLVATLNSYPTIAFSSQSRSTGASSDDSDEGDAVELTDGGPVNVEAEPVAKSKFRIKPVRFILLLLIVAAMYKGFIPYWLGGSLIAGYFIIKYAIRAAFLKLFTLPFAMKAKALSGATTEVHGIEWTTKPENTSGDEEDEKPAQPLRYVWIDVTISPPVRTQGFTHWEPGELLLAPAKTKIRSMDDLDKCFRVHDVRFIVDGQEAEENGAKVRGPFRIKVLAGIPENENNFKFAYYNESFGSITIPNG